MVYVINEVVAKMYCVVTIPWGPSLFPAGGLSEAHRLPKR